MAYIINIKHNVDGKTFPVKLHYNDASSNNPDITIQMTSVYADYTLTDWENVDASKIQVVNADIDEGSVVYHIKNENATIRTQS